ncbi:MAG TPA: hypothetical protein PLD25_25460 [Chloroflexota bacterium]|nr:hypothetical protein [Chloroflexota bacterium]
MKNKTIWFFLVLLAGVLAACGGGGEEEAVGDTAVPLPITNASDICAIIPANRITDILGRDLVSSPAAFDYYKGTTVSGCQWDGGKDGNGNAYFAYAAVLRPDAFTGFAGADAIAGLGDEAYVVNGPDAEQVWVRVGDEKTIVTAVGDAPNRDGAVELARYLLAFPVASGGGETAVAAPTTDTTTETTADTAVAPTDIPITTLPRAFTYAGVEFVVLDGRMTNRSLIDPNTATDQFRAELNIEGKNLSGFKADISNGTLRINFADGTVVEQLGVDPLEINETRAYAVSGAVLPTTQWEGATLALSEAGTEPLTINLTGAETITGQPTPLTTGGEATGLNKYDESIQYQVIDTSIWLDGPQPGGFYIHVPLGKEFVMVTVKATNTGGQSGVSIYSEQFQILADGEPFAVSYDVNGAQAVTLNTSTEVSYYFLIPANAANLQLTVAADGKQPQQITLR